MSACAYLPGTWTALVCERLLALVGPAADERTVAALWDVAAAGGGVLEALVEVSEDPHGQSIALVTLSHSGLLHAALRGDVEVVIDTSAGMRSVHAGEGAQWAEVTAHDVPAVALRAAGGSPATAGGTLTLPLVGGVVLAAELRATATLRGTAVVQDVSGGGAFEDPEGLTIVSGDLEQIRRSVPATGPVPTEPAPAPEPARIRLSTGLVVPLDRTALLGRAPQVDRVAAHELPRLVTVPSPQLDISRTHAEVRQEGEHVVVTDLDSLNGVRVVRSGTPPRRLHPGEPTVVGPDEVVDLGDGVTFTVEAGT